MSEKYIILNLKYRTGVEDGKRKLPKVGPLVEILLKEKFSENAFQEEPDSSGVFHLKFPRGANVNGALSILRELGYREI